MASPKDRQSSFRCRSTVWTERDELAYSRVLREFCPEVEFMGSVQDDDGRWRAAPFPNIPAAGDTPGLPRDSWRKAGNWDVVSIRLPAPHEIENWPLYREIGFRYIHRGWYFHFNRSHWEWHDPEKKWAFDLPLLGYGELVVNFAKGNQEMDKFARKLLWLRNKVSWKRTIYGLDACRWSQSGGQERRGLGNGILIDPREKIELNKYYDDSLWDDRLPEIPAVRMESTR